MANSRLKENESRDYIFNINLKLIGKPRLEDAIERYLQETLERYFLENGEKVKSLEITNIHLNK